MSAVIPRATYRLQLHAGFRFDQARAIVPYLARLGVSHVYLSPILTSRGGSEHGYDVTDPTKVDPELGGEGDFRRLVATLREHGMGVVLDIVPNHMAATPENFWWRDVLRRGRGSPFATFFDVDWESAGGKILLPLLGSPLDEAIELGEVRIAHDGDAAALAVGSVRLPLADSLANLAQGSSTTSDLLALLDTQQYQLVPWRTVQPNYRRFFNINDLIGLRVEEEDVFEATHALLFRLIQSKLVDGLRVDHIDGLWDPLRYLQRLRSRTTQLAGYPLYLIVEKILAPEERLPEDWPVDGTTGYDFLGVSGGVLVDQQGWRQLGEIYRQTAASRVASFSRVVRERKRFVLADSFAAELEKLARDATALARTPLTLADAETAIREVTACLPVYRTYWSTGEWSANDRRYLQHALKRAALLHPAAQGPIHEFGSILRSGDAKDPGLHAAFVRRWQQLSGPAMAKGLEDSAFYRHNHLLSLNEVGGHAIPVSLRQFHRFNAHRGARWAASMSATSTHDTKRSEDARSRLHVLADFPQQWNAAISRWFDMNAKRKRRSPSLDLNIEMHYYQTLVATWPLGNVSMEEYRDRLLGYVLKAARESGERTTWTNQNETYEEGLRGFIGASLLDARFIRSVDAFVRKLVVAGAVKALTQLTLKMTAPGIPDIYQGQELWDFSMVDPDNRRPIDYEVRTSILAQVETASPATLLEEWTDGRVKLSVTWCLLQLRRAHPGLLATGSYMPLAIQGTVRPDKAIAFVRRLRDEWLLVLVPRIPRVPFGGGWPVGQRAWGRGFVALPARSPRAWVNQLTGEEVRMASRTVAVRDVLKDLPVGVFLGGPLGVPVQ